MGIRKIFVLILFVSAGLLILFQQGYGNKMGAQPGYSGSPHDAKTCAYPMCHTGPVTAIANLITSNVPAAGYIPGNTYTITATVSSPNRIRFGFEISPQDDAGNLLGTLVITDPARMKFAGIASKYITHDSSGTWAPSHTNIWSFDWVAPAAGTGCVTFYGAFNYANNNNQSTGDSIHTSTLTVCEDPNGIHDPMVISQVSAFPNPFSNQVELKYELEKPERVIISLIDPNGSEIFQLFEGVQSGGTHVLIFQPDQYISQGIYFLQMKTDDGTLVKKLVKL